MAVITSMGIGAGLDVAALVSKLVAAEGEAPTKRLDRQEAELQVKLSALGTFKGALSELQGAFSALKDPATFQARIVTSSNLTVFTASASPAASVGTHSVVVSKLAQAHTLASAPLGDPTAVVGSGALMFEFGTLTEGGFVANAAKPAQTVAIEAANQSLQAIRDAVNSAKIGVRASLVNDGTGYRLVFTATDPGAANSLKITVTDNDGNNLDSVGLSQLAYDPQGAQGAGKNLVETIAAQDAEVTIDGLVVKSPSNAITGAIEGVTLTLLSAPPTGNSGTLTVAANAEHIVAAIEGLVAKYNSLIRQVNTLAGFDPKTKKAGVLTGDFTLRHALNQIRRVFGETPRGQTDPYTSFIDLGVTTQSDGSLKLDRAKLQSALETDLDAVRRVFAADAQSTLGVANRLDALLSKLLDSNGLINTATTGLESRIGDLAKQRVALASRLTVIEQRYRAQFTALDTLIGQLRATGDFLTRQLAMLPGGNPQR